MEPTGIEAADENTCDIQHIKDEPAVVPGDVEELLALLTMHACEEINRYAFLLCDSSNWKLIGWFNHYAPPHNSEEATYFRTFPASTNSSGGKKDLEMTMVLKE